MKPKQEFVLRTIGGETVLVPVGSLNDNFHGIISLNETGKFIWERLSQGQEPHQIAEALTEVYDVEKEQADRSVEKICGQLKELGIL